MDWDSDPVDLWFTIGPNSRNPLSVQQLIEAGATGVRLGFAFGDHDLQTQRARMVRNASEAANKECKVIADLPGEKIRLGDFGGTEEYPVEAGDSITMVPVEKKFNPRQQIIPVESGLFPRIESGDTLLIGDGSVSMEVKKASEGSVICDIKKGGVMNPNRGVIVRAGEFEPQSLTEKDQSHLRYVAGTDLFDGVALSFVSSANDVEKAKEILSDNGRVPPIIAKIETKSGIENIEEICEVSDAVMVARGDLALFLPWKELGSYVDHIVTTAKQSETPCIVATQVAEGLERFSFPTRAEICDLTHWTKRGAAGVLLSYETAFGSAPVDAVDCVREILDHTECGQTTVELS